MTAYWCVCTSSFQDLPLKVQAQSITNNGKEPIYIFDITDDVPISGAARLLAFSSAVINPGQQLDITNHPSFNGGHNTSFPDYDITIHSEGDIDVAIISSDICDRWITDNKHPWNGALLPNGTRTNNFKQIKPAVPNNPTPIQVPITTGMTAAQVAAITKKQLDSNNYEISFFIDDLKVAPKCECGKEKHGFASHSTWCDFYKK